MWHKLTRIVRITALGLGLGLLAPGGALAGDHDGWRVLAPGISMAFYQAQTPSLSGSDRLCVLRVDPASCRFGVLAAEKNSPGYDAGQWRQRTGAYAVFNAGQYSKENTYLGLLIKDGVSLNRPVLNLDGLFLAEPTDHTLPLARIVDLRYTAFQFERNPYQQAAQSLMLLDRFNQVRVKRTKRLAHRSLLAQDELGHIIIMVSEGKHTLWELAECIKEMDIRLFEVMCLDGGAEAQIDLSINGVTYQQYGEITHSTFLPLPKTYTPLPVALAIFPR